MSAPAFVLEGLAVYIRRMDGHQLAETLKLCAAEMHTRTLPGHQVVYDVAFEIHAVISADRVAAAVATYYAREPMSAPTASEAVKEE